MGGCLAALDSALANAEQQANMKVALSSSLLRAVTSADESFLVCFALGTRMWGG